MEYLQSVQEIQENIAELERRLLPSVMDPNSNGQTVKEWLEDYRSDGGKVDCSVENLHSAVLALHRGGKIRWATGKAPKKIDHRAESLANKNAQNFDKTAPEIIREAENQRRANRIIDGLRAFVGNFTSHPHSKTYAGREILQKELSRLLEQTPNPNLEQAEQIEKVLRAKEASLWS